MLESLRPSNLFKKNSRTGVFCEFCEIYKNTFFHRIPLVAASYRKTGQETK